MYNFGRDETRLWRSTTPRASLTSSGSQVSLRRRISGDDAADFCLPRERAVDVPANFVAKPRRGGSERPDPAPPPPPPPEKKKKRKLPRLKIRFTRKKRSAQVEWPAEALEAAAAVERAASASPPLSFTDSQSHGVRGTRLFPALGERPPHVWGDDVTSSGLGSSWETGLSVCSSSLAERTGLVRHPSFRPSVRRFRRAEYCRSGSPSSDSFRRTASCPYELSWGADGPEHPAVSLDSLTEGQADRSDDLSIADAGSEPSADAAVRDAETSVASISADVLRSAPEGPTSDDSDSRLQHGGGSSSHTTSSTSSNPDTNTGTADPTPVSAVEAGPLSPSVSVERLFGAQLAHHRPMAAGIQHYWRVRQEEERLGTFHVQEASVQFEHLPRNIQPFVLYHRPLVAEIKTFWARRRQALRQKARTCAVEDVSAQDSLVDGVGESARSGGGGGDGDTAEEGTVSVQSDEAPPPPSQNIPSEPSRGDKSKMSQTDGVTLPGDGSASGVVVEERPALDAGSVEQVRADLDGLQPLADFGYLLPPVTRSRPPPPRRARTAAIRPEMKTRSEAGPAGSGPDSSDASAGLSSDLPPADPQTVPAGEGPDPRPVAAAEDSASVLQVVYSRRKRTPPVVIPPPAIVITTKTSAASTPAPAARTAPADDTPSSKGSASTTAPIGPARSSSFRPGAAAIPARTSSLDSTTGLTQSHAQLSGSSPDSTPPEPASRDRPTSDLSRSSSFASARSFWRSLQDLRPIQENERLRKKVSFREEQTKKRKDPVAVFFRHLLQKSESTHGVHRPPPAAPPRVPPREVHRSTLPVEPRRRRVAHTNSLPNTVETPVEPEPRSQPESLWSRRKTWDAAQSSRRIPELQEPQEAPVTKKLSSSVRQLLGPKPVQSVAPYHLERMTSATASSRRFIRPGVVRQLQAQFENLARQH